MEGFLKDKKMVFEEGIRKKAVVLVIATIFIIGAFTPAVNSQVGRIVDDQLFEKSEEIEIQGSDQENNLNQNGDPAPLGVGDPWWDTEWFYRKEITINHTKVTGDSPLLNFPVLINIIDTDLVVKAQDDGDDIVFMDDNGDQLNHEIELFNGGTGELVAWVNVTSLSDTSDTTLYMYYGNLTCDSQENVNDTWDSNYVGVWHLNETSGTIRDDSTSQGNNVTPTSGIINVSADAIAGNSADFENDDSEYLSISDASQTGLDVTGAMTMSAWVKTESQPWGWINLITKWAFHNDSLDPQNSYYVAMYPSGAGHRVKFVMEDDNGQNVTMGDTELALATWYYVVVSYDGSYMRVYVNGSSDASPVSRATGARDSTSSFGIGGKETAEAYRFDGLVDEVRVSHVARSVGWINTSFLNQDDPSGFYSVGQEEIGIYPDEPVLSNENPEDGATDVGLNPVLSVHVVDHQGDNIDISFRTNASGSWQTISNNASVNNETVYCYNTNLINNYNTVYWWSVNATDSGSGNWTNATYVFTTEPNEHPVFSDEDPSDGSTHVPVTISSLSVLIEDPEGDSYNWTIETSPYIGSNSGTGEYNGTKTCTVVSGLNYDTTYTWYVNATDSGSGEWTNTMYTFTTEQVPGDWGYFKKITIDHTMVDADLTNFPILFHNTSSDFSSHAQSDGDDFAFMDSINTTQYNHEIEYYNSITGELIAWVNITYLSSTTDTIIWLYYGNASTTNQENVAGTWSDGFVGVWHLTDTNDSTSYNNDGSAQNGVISSADGIVGDCFDFEKSAGDNDVIVVSDSDELSFWDGDGDKPFSVTFWAKHESIGNKNHIFEKGQWGNDLEYVLSSDNGILNFGVTACGADSGVDDWMVRKTNNNEVVADVWTHWAGTYDGSESVDGIDILKNGDIVDTITAASGTYSGMDKNIRDLTIGNTYTENHGHDGLLDEVRLHNVERNQSWVKTEYNTIFYGYDGGFLSVGSEHPVQPPIDTTSPEITNVDAQPDPQEVGGYVNIACDVYDNVAVDTVMVNITYPDASTVNVTMLGGSYYYNISYSVIGTYFYFIWANDTSDNSAISSTDAFVIVDTTPPVITNVDAQPDPQEVGGFVNITCDVDDNVGVGEVFLNITYPDSSFENFSISANKTGNVYYCNRSYSQLGSYNYFIWANDTSGNSNISALCSFDIQDRTPPQITDVDANPNLQEVGGFVNITCDIDDNVAVGEVWVDISGPVGFTPINTTMDEGSYYYNISYSVIGTYSYFIWANDTSGNSDTSAVYNFYIYDPSIIYVDDDYDEITPGWGYYRFDSIQNGIDAVFENGVVYVYNGTYNENVVIDKTINLTGESKENTIIAGDGSGDVIYISADWVNITGFTLQNSSSNAGIYVNSNYSAIYGNIFTDSYHGVYINESSKNNSIYHNNFINNTQNAYDESNNTWDDGYPSGGNYWSDYIGDDDYHGSNQNLTGGDGIGDIPYNISGDSQDRYPVVNLDGWINVPPYIASKPSGRIFGTTGREYMYTTGTVDPEGYRIYYNFSWGDSTFSGWTGPYDSGGSVQASHAWSNDGTYVVRVRAKDTRSCESEWSESLSVRIFGVQVRKMEDPVVHPPMPLG